MVMSPYTSHCPQCELLLPTACARCQRPFGAINKLRAELAQSQSEVAQLKAQMERIHAANLPRQLFPDVLPPMEAWKMLLVREAARRARSLPAASRLIGIGHTTIYRMLREEQVDAAAQ